MGVAERHIGHWACAGALLLALATPTTAVARPGALDRSFGGDGKVVTAIPPEPLAMAVGRRGAVVVASGEAIARYLPSGKADRHFGNGGMVRFDAAGPPQFRFADLAVDSQGRIVVAGTVPHPEGAVQDPPGGPTPSAAAVMRYTQTGEPDPSFDGDGVFVSDLGALGPSHQEGSRYRWPAPQVESLAIDSQDRPVLTGRVIVEVYPSDGSLYSGGTDTFAFVARVTAHGALDPTFAGNGFKPVGTLSWLEDPAVAPGDGVISTGKVYASARSYPAYSFLIGVGADGSMNDGFGAAGVWDPQPGPTAAFEIRALFVTPSGRTLLLVQGPLYDEVRVIRLLPDGSSDQAFGRRGNLPLDIPSSSAITAIAADRRERILLAGWISSREPSKRRDPRARFFVLTRLKAAGRLDRRFSRDGSTVTGFGRRSRALASQVALDGRGRIVLGGTYSTGPWPGVVDGFALARYLSR